MGGNRTGIGLADKAPKRIVTVSRYSLLRLSSRFRSAFNISQLIQHKFCDRAKRIRDRNQSVIGVVAVFGAALTATGRSVNAGS